MSGKIRVKNNLEINDPAYIFRGEQKNKMCFKWQNVFKVVKKIQKNFYAVLIVTKLYRFNKCYLKGVKQAWSKKCCSRVTLNIN
jgi:hypothetical protein